MAEVLTLKPLIAVLQDYADRFGDLEVLVTWEGITRELTRDHVYRGNERNDGSLFIDADENFYKDTLAHPGEPNREKISRYG
jgi:hypothetical protein